MPCDVPPNYSELKNECKINSSPPSLRALIVGTSTAVPVLLLETALSVFLACKADTPSNIILNFKIIHFTKSIMYRPVETSLWASVMKRLGQVSPEGK